MPNQFLSGEGDLENYFVTEYWLIDQWVGDTLWVWGDNSEGQLGDNTITLRSTPVTTFAGGTNWKQVSGGGFHIAAIKTDGTLWTWGNNGGVGQLGNNAATRSSTPVTTFAGGTNWKQVASGCYHTAAIKTDGTLWTWGDNSSGQLGDNTTTDRSTPVTTFAGGTNWKQVACNFLSITAIKTDGTLWFTGRGIGDNSSADRCTPVTTFAGGANWKQVAGAPTAYHTAAIKTDGTLWVWGGSNFGQLGDNTSTNKSTPITTFAGGTNWKQVACSRDFTAAIKTDGTLWTWGRNSGNLRGKIGDNTTTNRSIPVTTFAGGTNWKQVTSGYNTTVALKTDGTLWGWGWGYYGHLGIDINAGLPRCTPITTFAGGTNWKQVSCGYYYTAAITSGTDPTFFIS